MKSLGEIIAGANVISAAESKKALWEAAVKSSEDEFRRTRPWKVSLCVMIFSEVEVTGNMLNVDRLAEASADKATVTMHTAPAALRRFVQKRSDPKNPESPLEWVEVVYGPIDPLDADSPLGWSLKK